MQSEANMLSFTHVTCCSRVMCMIFWSMIIPISIYWSFRFFLQRGGVEPKSGFSRKPFSQKRCMPLPIILVPKPSKCWKKRKTLCNQRMLWFRILHPSFSSVSYRYPIHFSKGTYTYPSEVIIRAVECLYHFCHLFNSQSIFLPSKLKAYFM